MTPFPDFGAWSRTVDVDGPTHYLDMGGPSGGPVVIFGTAWGARIATGWPSVPL